MLSNFGDFVYGKFNVSGDLIYLVFDRIRIGLIRDSFLGTLAAGALRAKYRKVELIISRILHFDWTQN